MLDFHSLREPYQDEQVKLCVDFVLNRTGGVETRSLKVIDVGANRPQLLRLMEGMPASITRLSFVESESSPVEYPDPFFTRL